jgi:ATP-dependent helicase/DNAse subunit B
MADQTAFWARRSGNTPAVSTNDKLMTVPLRFSIHKEIAMTTPEQDVGVLAVLMERFESQRLPRALTIKAKVDKGECLDEFDMAFLQEVLADSTKVMPMLERHPEHRSLISQVTSLYREITEKALANQKAAG